MKLLFYVSLLLVAFSCTRPKPHSIGVVNMKVFMERSSWGKKHQALISSELAKREKMWEVKCGNPMKKLVLDIEKSKKEKSENLESLKKKQKSLYVFCSRLKNKYHSEVETINEKYAGMILKKVKENAVIIAKNLKLDLVLTKFRGVILYASDRVDITEKVILAVEDTP